ncbi:metallopeptidase MepB [Mycena rebaudengoi]|nr:metallopeptidase MepB [Mycena rebaudengoi]
MVLGLQLWQPARRRHLARWGGVVAVGLAAVGWRSFASSGNFKFRVLHSKYTSAGAYAGLVRQLHFGSRALFSTITFTSQMPSLTPPQPPPEWTHTPEDVLRLTKEAIAHHRAVEDKVAAFQPLECNYESLALQEAETEFGAVNEPLSFYQNVSPSKQLRDASTAADSQVRDYGVESSMRLDVFHAKVAAEKHIKDTGLWEKLSSEEQRLVDKMILDGKRAGLALPEKERNTLMALQKELSQVCLEFDKNFNEENGVISFTKEELKGVPADVISGYTKRSNGSTELFDVTFKTPDIFPVFKFAESPETRQRAYEGHESRLEINVPLVDKFLGLRRQIAKILQYPTWADYRTETKMVKTGKGVVDFLNDLEKKLRPVGIKDRETLLALKKKEHEKKNLPFDGEFYIWDYRYYDRKFIESSLDLDDMLVKEYFPVSFIVPEIIKIYQNLLGVRFETSNGSTWHPDVQQYSVWEKDATDETGFIGYCYLDLFPRESKYSHAAVWPLLAGYELPNGKRHYPTAAMVANLAKSTPDKPALMRHDDVVTFFHEMGHVFHGLLSSTKFARFHGTRCWEPKVLEQMSSHYQTKQPLSAELIEKIIKSRHVNVGLSFLRQIFFAKYDIKVHTDQEKEDYTKLWDTMREKISLVKSKKPCPGQATVFKGDPLDPARGKLYRDKILKYGGSREELDSLKDFLGRLPNSDAFLEELFGTAPAVANL